MQGVAPRRIAARTRRFGFGQIDRLRPDLLSDEKQSENNGPCQAEKDERRKIRMIHELVANKKRPYRNREVRRWEPVAPAPKIFYWKTVGLSR